MKLTKKHKRRKLILLDVLDYIFWRIYRFCKRTWLLDADPWSHAPTTLSAIIITPPACIYILLITQIPMPEWVLGIFVAILLCIVWLVMSRIYKRYQKSSEIVANNYELFRKKWNREPKKQRKRRKWLIVALFIFTCIICPILTMLTAILLSK